MTATARVVKRSDELPSRTDRKRADIYAAAADEFREKGFHGTSMDAIAARANVSKRTLYHHFASKDVLFDTVMAGFWSQLVPPDETEQQYSELPVEERLRTIARQRIETLLDPAVVGLVRVVLAESMRTPELSRAIRGEQRHLDMLGFRGILREEARRGRLVFDDLDLAISHFWGLVFDGLFFTVVLGLRGPVRGPERTRAVDRGVAAFVTLYGARPRRVKG
jgi:TetR/AcrR family transcriptional regulator, regulator of autoinduction and epiphytic fitness